LRIVPAPAQASGGFNQANARSRSWPRQRQPLRLQRLHRQRERPYLSFIIIPSHSQNGAARMISRIHAGHGDRHHGSRTEYEPCAADQCEIIGASFGSVDLATESTHVHIDKVCFGKEFVVPYVLEEFLARVSNWPPRCIMYLSRRNSLGSKSIGPVATLRSSIDEIQAPVILRAASSHAARLATEPRTRYSNLFQLSRVVGLD